MSTSHPANLVWETDLPLLSRRMLAQGTAAEVRALIPSDY